MTNPNDWLATQDAAVEETYKRIFTRNRAEAWKDIRDAMDASRHEGGQWIEWSIYIAECEKHAEAMRKRTQLAELGWTAAAIGWAAFLFTAVLS